VTRTAFVSGGAGFIGLNVVDLLLERGYRVRVFDNMTRGNRERLDELVAGGDVELVEQDVRYGGAVRQAMEGCSVAVHLSAVSIMKSVADPFESIDINFVGNHNMFAAAAAVGVDRLVYASSASVYGEPESLPMYEDGPVAPLTPYCISKLAGEHLAGFYERQTGLPWTALRFFNVYGPGQKPTAYYTSVINHFVKRLRNGEPPVIDGDGEQSMDFVHVTDVARAVAMAVDAPAVNGPVNIGTGVSTSVRELAHILIDAVGADVEPIFNKRPVLVSRRAAAIDRARDLLGWTPLVSVEDGMRDLIKAESL
jgi:UDP-glucose 4-epimerase